MFKVNAVHGNRREGYVSGLYISGLGITACVGVYYLSLRGVHTDRRGLFSPPQPEHQGFVHAGTCKGLVSFFFAAEQGLQSVPI